MKETKREMSSPFSRDMLAETFSLLFWRVENDQTRKTKMERFIKKEETTTFQLNLSKVILLRLFSVCQINSTYLHNPLDVSAATIHIQ